MGKRKKKTINLYIPEELLNELNDYCADGEIDRNTTILAAIGKFLADESFYDQNYDGDNEYREDLEELFFYLDIAGISINDVVKLIKSHYRQKFEKAGLPIM